MRKIFFLLFIITILSGCATGKTVPVNLQKTAAEIDVDKKQCRAAVDSSDFKDEDLKEKKFNQCLSEKGYKPVSEKEVVDCHTSHSKEKPPTFP